ncbi:MAG: ADP-ribosylglycohydrolase family protein [Candidatus Lokiarchaeota archaeon]
MNKISYQDYYNKVYGSWLGRVAGDFMGAPLEFKPYHYIKFKYGNIKYFPKPIDLDYVNDDEMYEICALIALEKYGPNLTAKDIAKVWLNRLYTQNYTAEKVALKNLRRGINPPKSGTYKNIFYDAIGAQMRADIWGLITPGNPDIAKYYAKMDGSISHGGIGIEGEIFIADLISQAFFEDNIYQNIQSALTFISKAKESLYTKMVKKSIQIYEENPKDFRRARVLLMKYWNRIRWSQLIKKGPFLSLRNIIFLNKFLSGVHVLPNIGIIILALLYGKDDKEDPFGKSISIAAMMGLDTDCNCGNIGAILGAQFGEENIPKKWKVPLMDSFSTYVRGYEKWKISELSNRIVKVGIKVIEMKGSTNVKIY